MPLPQPELASYTLLTALLVSISPPFREQPISIQTSELGEAKRKLLPSPTSIEDGFKYQACWTCGCCISADSFLNYGCLTL